MQGCLAHLQHRQREGSDDGRLHIVIERVIHPAQQLQQPPTQCTAQSGKCPSSGGPLALLAIQCCQLVDGILPANAGSLREGHM